MKELKKLETKSPKLAGFVPNSTEQKKIDRENLKQRQSILEKPSSPGQIARLVSFINTERPKTVV